MNSKPLLHYYLENQIRTDYSGYSQLANFYHFCKVNPGDHIHIDFSEVNFFDGNLSALLWAIVHKANKENGNTFQTEASVIKERFSILYRNGFLPDPDIVYDERDSTIPIKAFDCKNKVGFSEYIENTLLKHRGISDHLNSLLSEKIADDLLEVFGNTTYHANTTDPFFVGGQYYPKMGVFKFTMVDIGDGFLPRVQRATNGEITDNLEAIKWAVKGNSTKMILDGFPGGLGIQNMHKYCKNNNGVLQIISNDGFWASDLENTFFSDGRRLKNAFQGTTINIIFHKK